MAFVFLCRKNNIKMINKIIINNKYNYKIYNVYFIIFISILILSAAKFWSS